MSQNVQDEMNSVINKFVDSIELRLDRAKREKGADFIVEGMDNHLHRYTLALVLNCFYKRDDIVDLNADTNHWQTVIEDACKLLCSRITMIPLLFPMVNPVMKLITKISHPLNKIQVLLLSFIKDQIELYKRASLESKKLDGALDEAKFRMRDGTVFKGNIIDYFIGKFMDKSITEREFCHSSFLIFVASVKDIMELSSRLLYLLACNQNAQNKLRESIKSDGIESIYLKWAINETLRLFPPAHIGCSRTLTRDLESKFGIIPKDTFLNTPLWTLHRWSEYWGEDANDFKPERWVKSDTFHPLQYLPFGAGRRVCPGKEFSLINVRMLMVRLLTRFKFEKCEKTLEEPDFQTPFFIITVSKDLNWLKISRTDNLGDDI